MMRSMRDESRQIDDKEYGFFGKERAYAAFRPNWGQSFAEYILAQSGFRVSPDGWVSSNGRAPRIACMGAGTGADAAVFKMMGCDVALVEPNAELLRYAEEALTAIPGGRAHFHQGNAVRSGLEAAAIDLIICAQSIHTMKHAYSAQHLDKDQRESGVGAEEWARRHWADLIRDESSQIGVWYYNPDPDVESVRVLHEILAEGAPSYAASSSPFFEAEYFKPKHFQPWISADRMEISPRMTVDTVRLKRGQVADWLSSYSFAPKGAAFDSIVDSLRTGWFDRFNEDGLVVLPYVGFVAAGPLRKDAFDIDELSDRIDLSDPLLATR